MYRASSASLLDPDFDDAGWFGLSGPVGMGKASARDDAIRLEGILANSGDLDLGERGGPTGYWGLAQDAALRRYQKRNALAVDGWAAPGGETIAHMRDAFGPLLDGHDVPTPDDVDAHHEDRAKGGSGGIALAPRQSLGAIPGLPDIGNAGRASNAAQIDWLTGKRVGFDGVPEQLARYVREQGDGGLAQARDFLDQFQRRRPGDADALLAGILRQLPEPAMRTRFLGDAQGDASPAGVLRTKEVRADDPPAPLVTRPYRPEEDDKHARIELRLASDDAGAGDSEGTQKPADPQLAQATPPAPDNKRPPAYRADVFAAQPGVWDAMQNAVKGDASLNDSQRAAIMAVFAGEGGLRPDPKSGAVGGITKGYIADAREQGNWPPALAHVKAPADLKAEDMPGMYRHYLDGALRHAGGFDALGKIGNPTVAAAIADTVVRDGEQGARALIHDSIKDSGGSPNLSDPRKRRDGEFEPAVIGRKTLEELVKFGGDPDKAAKLLEALEKRRSEKREDDKVRNKQFILR